MTKTVNTDSLIDVKVGLIYLISLFNLSNFRYPNHRQGTDFLVFSSWIINEFEMYIYLLYKRQCFIDIPATNKGVQLSWYVYWNQ